MKRKPAITCVIGTRPDIIKMAPVINTLNKERHRYRVTVLSAGQHGGLHNRTCAALGITPDRNLRLLRPSSSLTDAVSRTVTGFGNHFTTSRPDLVIVQGDTTTALGAALAAYHHKIPIAHVEAGLRTRDMMNPHPEEMNRCTITTLAALHFAPTAAAAANLKEDGVPGTRITVTGNTVVDALKTVMAGAHTMSRLNLQPLLQSPHPYLVCTIHRRENQGKILTRLAGAVRRIAAAFPDSRIVLPVHPNPGVSVPLKKAFKPLRNVMLIRPLDYTDMVLLLKHAGLILTDSGGLQEEAAVLGTPTLVLREKTERPELLTSGTGILAGTEPERIVTLAHRILTDRKTYDKMSQPSLVFGKGNAAEKIERHIRAFLTKKLS